MSKLRLEEAARFLSTTRAAQELGLSPYQFRKRVQRGLLPAPTQVKRDGTCMFSPSWLKEARRTLAAAQKS